MKIKHQRTPRNSIRRAGFLATKELCLILIVLAGLVWGVVPQLLYWATLQDPRDAKARSSVELASTEQGVLRMSLDRTGRRLWVSRLDRSVVQYHVATGTAEQSLPSQDVELLSVGHSGDGLTSLMFSIDGEVALFRNGNQLQFVHGLGKDFHRGHTELSADGNLAMIILDDGRVEGWVQLKSESEPFSYTLQNKSKVDCTALDSSGSLLFVAHRDGAATVYEARTGRVEKTLPRLTRLCTAADWSDDGQTLVVGFIDGSVRVFDVRSGKTIAEALDIKNSNLATPRIVGLAISATGKKVAVTATGSNDIFVWECHAMNSVHLLRGHLGQPWAVEFSPDGELLYSGGADGTIREWSLQTFTQQRTME